jgi:3-oxo-5-alpha-steroid 4-dehydrogenase 1
VIAGDEFYNLILLSWIVLAFVTFWVLTKITAPYGRHVKNTWGPLINHRLAWMIMESASPISFVYFFLNGNGIKTAVTWVFLFAWTLHYFNRSIIFPIRAKMNGRKMPILIMAVSIVFNAVNGYLNGYYLGNLSSPYPLNWFVDIRFITGIFLFLAGMLININADKILIDLRKPGTLEHNIPEDGLYHWISCPNYFGEIIEWCGFAIMTWSLPGFSFALWTAANLLPRASAHHAWYKEHFADYPRDRKAVIPFIW